MAINGTIPQLESQIEGLREQSRGLENVISRSSSGQTAPTFSETESQRSFLRLQKQIQAIEDEKLRQQWYPDTASTEETGEGHAKSGLIGSAIDLISRPLYATAGATRFLAGQAEGRGLYGSITENMLRGKRTYGDILRTAGAPWSVSAPLGFALDVAGDPLNWFVMGSGALIPRLATGAVKGAAREGAYGLAKGLSVGAKSGVLGKAVSVGRFTPYFKGTKTYGKIARKALSSAEEFEKLTGRTAEAIVAERGFGVGSYRVGMQELFAKAAESIPGGQKVFGAFKYDPTEWVRQARYRQVLLEAFGTEEDVGKIISARLRGEPTKELEAQLRAQRVKILRETPVSPTGKPTLTKEALESTTPMSREEMEIAASRLASQGMENKIGTVAKDLTENLDDAHSIVQNPSLGFTMDPVENALRIANEGRVGDIFTIEDMAKVINSGAMGDTGVRWFDSMQRTIRNFKIKIGKNSDRIVEVGNKVMDFYDGAMGVFRGAKVSASPVAWTNAIIGNAVMAHMAGEAITDPQYLSRLRMVYRLYRNKPNAAIILDDFIMNSGVGEEIKAGMAANQIAVKGTFGVTGKLIGARATATRILHDAKLANKVPQNMTVDQLTVLIDDASSAVSQFIQGDPELLKMRETLLGVKGGTAIIRESLAKAAKAEKASRDALLKSGKAITTTVPVSRAERTTGYIDEELFSTRAAEKMFEFISEKARTVTGPNKIGWQALDFMFNSMSSGYQTIDQVYKMTSFVRSTVDGYTLNQLRKMRHFVDISPEEVAIGRYITDEGITRYRLSAKTALELSNVTFMNYAAMPSAIKVLRNFPILGGPFGSFMYAMALKTGQTMVYNPAAFTKVQWAMKEFGGQKTPLEREALAPGGYYSYINEEPGMFKIPFTNENPLYLNLANMIPYYSMNIFEPSTQRRAGSGTLPEKLVERVHASPLVKDPVGSVLFDYLIQPMILSEGIQPQGLFGQALYPRDAGLTAKVGYGVRSLAEPFTPNILSYTGLATPQAAAPYIPSYRWRALAMAKAGKNQYGITGKEARASRTVRGVLGATGFPVAPPVNITYRPKKK